MIKIIIFLVILFPSIAIADCVTCHNDKIVYNKKPLLQDLVIVNAEKYLYVREKTNTNDAPEIDKFLAYLGLPKGLSWCAAYICFVHKESADSLQIKNPLPRIGRVSTLWDLAQENDLRYKTFDSEEVLSGELKLNKADIPIWESNNLAKVKNFNGHTGLILYQKDNNSFKSIEGNTTPNNKGDQREGGGVYERDRTLGIGTKFNVLGFIRVR